MTPDSKANAPQGPTLIFQMLNAAQVTAILSSAIELGVFSQLGGGPRTAEEVAQGISCPARTTRILLDAMSVIGLAAKEGNRYRLTPIAMDHLVPGKPMYMGDSTGILANPTMWTALSRLGEAVRNGGSVLPEHAETPNNAFWETFAKASGSMASVSAAALEGLLHDWVAAKKQVRVLDIAAGSGIYGYTMVAKNPNVELTSLDWPNVLVETKQWGERLGVDKKRVKYLEGNLFEVDYGGPYDLVIASHIYHHFEPSKCAALSRKIAQALAPGGRLAIQEFLPDGGNPAGILFSITMMVWSKKGEAYSGQDYKAWLTEAGLSEPRVVPSAGMPTSFIIADK